MKKTLIHSLTFPPDTISTGMIVSEIADGINIEYQNVEVLASSPQYNTIAADSVIQSKKNLNSRIYKDIKVHYIKSSQRQFSNTLRFKQWLIFNFKSISFIFNNRRNYDNILIFSYPPTMNLVCIFTSKILKINTIYSLWELYPEIAERLNEQPGKILTKIFKFIDNYSLKSVSKVVVNSEELKNYLVSERKIDTEKIHTILHFSPYGKSDSQPLYELSKIFYAGNTGRPQNLASFLRYFKEYFPNSWEFHLFGAGQEFDSLLNYSNDNVLINNYLPRDELEIATKEIPFALVCLDYEITIEGFPGKTFDYLNMNKILVNFSNPKSSVSKLIDKYGLGFNIDINAPEDVIVKLEQMKKPETIKTILKNIKYFQRNISNKEIVYKKYATLISSSS
jgi:hypothetical protein